MVMTTYFKLVLWDDVRSWSVGLALGLALDRTDVADVARLALSFDVRPGVRSIVDQLLRAGTAVAVRRRRTSAKPTPGDGSRSSRTWAEAAPSGSSCQ